jgi:hypothetical protein
MKYRLISKNDTPDEPSNLVFVQKMDNFDDARPATITVEAFLRPESLLFGVDWSRDFEIEFEDREIKSVNGVPLESVLDFDREFTIEFNFIETVDLEALPRIIDVTPSDDVLDAEIIE